MHVHACLLALHTGKPVKMVYNREESFFGHVHRHPARMRYEHGADRDGKLVYVEAEILLDGGAYASSTAGRRRQRRLAGRRPVRRCRTSRIDCYGVYTNNPPCGAMRGFGAVQAASPTRRRWTSSPTPLGHRPGRDPRCRNAHARGLDRADRAGDRQRRRRWPSCCAGSQAMPLPRRAPATAIDLRQLPGGVANTTHGEGVRRGVGYAVGYKNIGFSEGFDDYSTARVRLEVIGGEPVVTVHTAAAEVGQGLVTVQQQIGRTELGVDRVVVAPGRHRGRLRRLDVGVPADLRDRRRGQGRLRGRPAARADLAATRLGTAPTDCGSTAARSSTDRRPVVGLAEVLGDDAVEETVEWRHRPTVRRSTRRPARATPTCSTPSPRTAPSSTSTSSWAWSRWSSWPAAQDVGKAINPQAVVGQIHGGTAQGLGLALMEEIQVDRRARSATRRSPTT